MLPLLSPHSGRAGVTCRYRCANQCFHDAPNASENEYFGDVVQSVYSRRGLLKAGMVLAAGAGIAAVGGAVAADPAVANGLGRGPDKSGLKFKPVPPNTEDAIVVPKKYVSETLIRWGDPVLPGAPGFDFANQSADAQATQFGYNNDFCGLVPLGPHTWLMVSSHEYTSEPFLHLGYDPDNPTDEQIRIAWAAHGLSVVVVRRNWLNGQLGVHLDPTYNRRITVSTPFTVTGPAAGSDFLKTSADPTGTTVLGTLNNCAGGVTPWGTVLSGEENFHQYFANADAVTDPVVAPRLARYGISGTDSSRRWERLDARFDLAQEPNEVNRFGWIVEVDPHDPDSTPTKHTALGRFKHEGATVRVAPDGRVVAYMGDDERFDYIYKFVSDGVMDNGGGAQAREHNKTLLTSGTLYVARFAGDSPAEEFDGSGALPSDGEFDGTGEWIPLVAGDQSFVDGMTATEVYVFTRLAADTVAATKMDRPEDIEPNPVTGRVYAALTNNSVRGPDGTEAATEPNPRHENRHGHVIEWEEANNDPTATTFSWRILLVCGDPADPNTYFGGYKKNQVSPISCPDNVAFDSRGNLWISTDGNALGSNDGLFAVPLEGKERGRVRQFLTVPVGAETCGPVIDDNFVLVSVQHPGELDDASADNPMSHWPDGGSSQPRPSIAVIRREHPSLGRIGD